MSTAIEIMDEAARLLKYAPPDKQPHHQLCGNCDAIAQKLAKRLLLSSSFLRLAAGADSRSGSPRRSGKPIMVCD